MRLIDADEAYKVLTDYYHHRTEIQHEALKEALLKVPTVDPFIHSSWKREEDEFGYYWACSHCGNFSYNGKSRYCPHCGAQMEKTEEHFK